MSFDEELKIAHAQVMSIDEFVSKHRSIPKDYVKKVRYMTDQLVEGEWKGLSLDIVDGLFLEKQRVREAIDELENLYYEFGVPDNEEPCVILQEVRERLGYD